MNMSRIKTIMVGSMLSVVAWSFTISIVQLSLALPQ